MEDENALEMAERERQYYAGGGQQFEDLFPYESASKVQLRDAVSAGCEQLITYLLNHGADLQKKTILSFAKNVRTAQLLLAAGADIYTRGPVGQSLLADAMHQGKEAELITFYRQYLPIIDPEDEYNPLHWLSKASSYPSAFAKACLLLHGLPAPEIVKVCSQQNSKGQTPLMMLSAKADEESKKLLAFLQQRLEQAQKELAGAAIGARM